MTHVELGLDERRRIGRLHRAAVPVAAIKARLRRHRSTIYRGLARNEFAGEENPFLDGYNAMAAQEISARRRHRRRKLVRMSGLMASVVDLLRAF